MKIQDHDASISLDEAVLIAICYADCFDYCLKKDELLTYLPLVKTNMEQVKAAIVRLKKASKIKSCGPYLFLPGRDNLMSVRHHQDLSRRSKLAKLQKVLPFIICVPWLRTVLLTGPLSAQDPTTHRRAGLMLVFQSNRMWIGLLMFKLFCKLFPIFRASYVMSEKSLSMLHPNIYTAIELSMVTPLKFSPDLAEMEKQNRWFRAFLPNSMDFTNRRIFMHPAPNRWVTVVSRVIGTKFGCVLNQLSYQYYKRLGLQKTQITPFSFSPYPPTRQHIFFSKLIHCLDEAEVKAPAFRAHLKQQLRQLDKEVAEWGIKPHLLHQAEITAESQRKPKKKASATMVPLRY